jgi:hypothetical protein
VTSKKGPVEDLAEAQKLVAAGRVEFFKTSARLPLAAKYGDERKGVKRAMEIFATLGKADYEHTRHLPNPPATCDVYGVECDGEQWYVKFYVDVDVRPPHDEIVRVVSFHPERFEKVKMARRRKVVIQ